MKSFSQFYEQIQQLDPAARYAQRRELAAQRAARQREEREAEKVERLKAEEGKAQMRALQQEIQSLRRQQA